MGAAGDVGIYMGVMLFDGWALHLSPPPDHIEGHPFHIGDNINFISASSINDLQVPPLDPRVQAVQEAYIRKVVDTLLDLPDALWEVANESSGDGTVTDEFAAFLAWTRHRRGSTPPNGSTGSSIRSRGTRAARGYGPHPIGMTMLFPVAEQTKVNDPLLGSRASAA